MCLYFNIIKMSFHSLLSERILRDKDVPQCVKVPADSLATRVGFLEPIWRKDKTNSHRLSSDVTL